MRDDARLIAESLQQGDHTGLDRKLIRGVVGWAALVLGCVTPTRTRDSRSPVRFVVANPVAHGARLGAAVAAILPEGATVVTDHRLAAHALTAGEDFPALAPQSMMRIATLSRLGSALRLRRRLKALPAGDSRVFAEYLFLAQAIRFAAARDALIASGTKLVLVDFDRAAYTAPWIHGAKTAGIATATLVHGVPNEWNYLPVMADDVLVWGEVQAAWLRSHSTSAGIHIVGRPDVMHGPLLERHPAQLVVSHSAEQLSDGEVGRVRDRIVRARKQGMEVVLRLHPSVSEDRLGDDWRSVAEAADRVVSGTTSLSEGLGADDVVVAISSSSVMDALARGVRAEVLADPERPLPADLEVLARAGEGGAEVDPARHVAFVGGDAAERIRAWIDRVLGVMR